MTCVVATVLPALGAYQFHGMTPESHAGLSLEFTDSMTAPMLWLRAADFSEAMPAFRDLRLITFPSWHAAAAIVFILAAWPIARLRALAVLINAAMIAATPVQGSHYLTDMIVGAGIGVAAFLAAHGLLTLAPLPASRRAQAEALGGIQDAVARSP